MKKIVLLFLALAMAFTFGCAVKPSAMGGDGGSQQISVAVLPSDGDKKIFDDDDLNALTDKMRSVALKVLPREKFDLLTQDVVVKRLGGAESFLNACKESSCIVDLGKAAQVDYVAQASIGKIRDKMRIKVEVYEVSTSKLVGMYDGDGEFFDDFFVLLKAVDENVSNIFGTIPGAVIPKTNSAYASNQAPASSGYYSPTPAAAASSPDNSEKTSEWGFRTAANLIMYAPPDEMDFSVDPGYGFTFGFFKTTQIGGSLSYVWGVDFAMRSLFSTEIETYDFSSGSLLYYTTDYVTIKEEEFAISMPFLLKLGSSFNIFGGLQIDIPFNAVTKNDTSGEEVDVEERASYDLGFVYGLGFQIGKVEFDFRGVMGLTEVIPGSGTYDQYGFGISFLF